VIPGIPNHVPPTKQSKPGKKRARNTVVDDQGERMAAGD
jgi:hypothetical protein